MSSVSINIDADRFNQRSSTPQVVPVLSDDSTKLKSAAAAGCSTFALLSPLGYIAIQTVSLLIFITAVVFSSVSSRSSPELDAVRSMQQSLKDLNQQRSTVSSAELSAMEEVSGLTKKVQGQHGVLVESVVHDIMISANSRVAKRIDKTKATVKEVARKVQRKMDEVPVPRVQAPQANSGYVEEYPTEAVDDIPGPAYKQPPDELDELEPEERNTKRREAAVDAFKHAWKGYKKYAWRYDEFQPRSKNGKNWNEQDSPTQGLGLTILDGMTTAYLMGLEDHVDDALDFIKHDLSFKVDVEASVFESTIRMLGSLLSLYELTGEKHKYILDKATELGDRLLWAFNTTTGLPHATVNLATHRHSSPQWSGGAGVLSEFGTVQLEMRTLSYHTKNPVYDMKATHVMAIVRSQAPKDMLCPTYMSLLHYKWMTDHISLGAMGDSFYEYLLKQYLLTNKTERMYKDMFVRAANGIVDKLLFYSQPSKWAYVAEYRRRDFYPKMDHLACFVAGTLALGAQEVDGLAKEELMEAAADLTETCVKMYTRQKSGVSPEYVEFPGQADFINGPGYYILRPETFEALFYMWRTTKEQKWRDYGWKMFRAIDRWCRVEEGGYSGLKEVNVNKPIKDNLQQSFWLAETLKYVYLLFADDDAINLKEWVFNTEAHPLKIRERDPLDVWRDYEEDHGEVPWHPPVLKGVRPIETEAMKKARQQTHSAYKPKKDNFGEYEIEDAPVDDEGMPFDPAMMSGIRRKPDAPGRGKPKRRHQQKQTPPSHNNDKDTPSGGDEPTKRVHKVKAISKKDFHRQRREEEERNEKPPPQQNLYEAEDPHEEAQPKKHRKVSDAERKAAIERQKELRRAEREKDTDSD